jgi:hypothetical protein
MESGLNSHHRDTIDKTFSHPSSSNIEWRRVLSLLHAVGTATEEHNGKFKVVIGPETEIIDRPAGKDIDQQMIVDLRRMLTNAGFVPRIPGLRRASSRAPRRRALSSTKECASVDDGRPRARVRVMPSRSRLRASIRRVRPSVGPGAPRGGRRCQARRPSRMPPPSGTDCRR